jgi:hypothetical protein
VLEEKFLDMFTSTKGCEIPSCVLTSVHASHSTVIYRSNIGLDGGIYLSQHKGKFVQFCIVNLIAQHLMNFKPFVF